MPSSENARPKNAKAKIPFDLLVTLLSHKTRWLMLREFIKGKPLPVNELAKRVGVSPASASKHVLVLHQFGVIERGFGGLYELPAHFMVPGENAIDFGAALLRFDQLG